MATMNFGLRPMHLEDIPQVVEIEREAFPTTWPPTPFKKELQNRLATYLVAWIPWDQRTVVSASPKGKSPTGRSQSGILQWLPGVRHLFSRPPQAMSSPNDFIAGYVGIWHMADEAHIVAIAVRSAYQRLGLGELLMQGSVELSLRRHARRLTLEARVSNFGAHALYEKYGLQKTATRRAYYADNNEDAVIMTAEDISSAAYQELFRSLVEAYRQRRGDAVRILA